MASLNVFVGHSFLDEDHDVVVNFLNYFDRIKDMGIGFSWDHAEKAEPRVLSEKIKEKMVGKNLFIGICTVKERVIDPKKLRKCFLKKGIFMADKAAFLPKTSDWILQEIGFAFGQGMDMILLIEEGLRTPGGIQGDLEYIPFSRYEPEKSFMKLLEMINSLIPKETTSDIRVVARVSSAKEMHQSMSQEVPDSSAETMQDWTRQDYERRMLRAIVRGDRDRENTIYEAYLRTQDAKEENEQIRWKAFRLYWRHIFTKEETIQELKILSDLKPTHGDVHYYLGKIYEKYENYKDSANCFKKATQYLKDKKIKLKCLCDLAVALSRLGDRSGTDGVLEEAKALVVDVTDGKITLLETMSTISEIENNDDLYFAYNEGLINLQPDDHSRRFSLAWKYSKLGENDLSLYHYKIILNRRPGASEWNNIGVASHALELPCKSIEAYRESEKLGETLAMSNLSFKLIDAGFLEEANQLCNRAIKIENYDPQIGAAIARIKEVRENEEEKEQKILEGTKLKRMFFVEYAHACTRNRLTSISGIWEGPECRLDVIVKDGKFEATGSYEKQGFGIGLAAALSGIPGPYKEYEKKIFEVIYRGEIIGHGIKYRHWVREKGLMPSLLTDDSKEGLMYVSDDVTEIHVYEKGKRPEEKFYSLKQIT